MTVWTILWKPRLQSSLKLQLLQYYQPRLASEKSLVIKKNPLYFSLVSYSLEGHNALKQTHLHQLARSVSCQASHCHAQTKYSPTENFIFNEFLRLMLCGVLWLLTQKKTQFNHPGAGHSRRPVVKLRVSTDNTHGLYKVRPETNTFTKMFPSSVLGPIDYHARNPQILLKRMNTHHWTKKQLLNAVFPTTPAKQD